jgi:uncharacterized protein YdhG (YjbR/CyaY superfamily)
MKARPTAPKDIDEYIAGFPGELQKTLKKIKLRIRKAAPGAEETIKYQMPTYTLKGNLVHFAAYKAHTGFYPAPRGAEFKHELSATKATRARSGFLWTSRSPST